MILSCVCVCAHIYDIRRVHTGAHYKTPKCRLSLCALSGGDVITIITCAGHRIFGRDALLMPAKYSPAELSHALRTIACCSNGLELLACRARRIAKLCSAVAQIVGRDCLNRQEAVGGLWPGHRRRRQHPNGTNGTVCTVYLQACVR